MIFRTYSLKHIENYSKHSALETFMLVFTDFEKLDPESLIFPRSFFLSSFFSSFRFYFSRGNLLKSFIIKPYHSGNKAGTFLYTRYQSFSIHNRSKKKKTFVRQSGSKK